MSYEGCALEEGDDQLGHYRQLDANEPLFISNQNPITHTYLDEARKPYMYGLIHWETAHAYEPETEEKNQKKSWEREKG